MRCPLGNTGYSHRLCGVELWIDLVVRSGENGNLGPDHLRTYQAYLLKVRKLDPGSVDNHVAALRFLFVRTLHRHEFRQFLPYPKVRRKLPKILSKEEVARLIDASSG